MIEWRTAADWIDQALPEAPGTKSGFIRKAKKEGWQSRERQGRGGGLEYHYSSLPDRARAAYLLRHRKPATSAAPTEIPQGEAWASFDQLSQALKDEAGFRLKVLTAVEALVDGGVGRVSAVEMVAADAEVSPATVRRWVRLVKGVERRNWLPALAPRYVGKTDRAECDPRAWDWYLGQYLTRRGPSHADTYRRLEEIAAIEGWVIPSAKTLERRVETDIDPLSVVLMREGMEALARRLPACAGRLMAAELKALESALTAPDRPVVAVVAGAKVSTKLDLLLNLVRKAEHLVIGGGMANTFLAAKGVPVGRSLCEHDMGDTVREILARAEEAACTIHLPRDFRIAPELKPGVEVRIAPTCPDDWMILDAGPETTAALCKVFDSCRTLVWNGPLGAFEIAPFDTATTEAARHAAARTRAGQLVTVAGGGDTVAALNHAGVVADFSYVSTAGGAFLEWMEGKTLPGVAALER